MGKPSFPLGAIGVALAIAALAVAAIVAGKDRGEARPTAASVGAAARTLVELGPAAEGHASKDRVRDHLVERLRAAGAAVQVLPFDAKLQDGTTWRLENVVGSFRPDAKRRLLLGSHWDTRPWADEDEDPAKRGQPIQGANDGVSGAAVLLEVAAALGARPPPEGLGVDVVFFDGEEGPKGSPDYFLGSRELADGWFRTGLAAPEAAVVLDMVGKQGLRIRREQTSHSMARELDEEVFRLAKELGLRSFADGPGRSVTDDHTAFLRRGVPAILLIDMDYPAWHTSRDTLDKLDPAAMAEVATLLLAWVERRAR